MCPHKLLCAPQLWRAPTPQHLTTSHILPLGEMGDTGVKGDCDSVGEHAKNAVADKIHFGYKHTPRKLRLPMSFLFEQLGVAGNPNVRHKLYACAIVWLKNYRG